MCDPSFLLLKNVQRNISLLLCVINVLQTKTLTFFSKSILTSTIVTLEIATPVRVAVMVFVFSGGGRHLFKFQQKTKLQKVPYLVTYYIEFMLYFSFPLFFRRIVLLKKLTCLSFGEPIIFKVLFNH